MVAPKGETKKRKRDDSEEPLSESPKRTKVHAQRKFAQGATLSSPAVTPIKDKDKTRPATAAPAAEQMLSSRRPNTEDFLTFLCFRRTSILPPELDFFKEALQPEPQAGTSAKGTSSGASGAGGSGPSHKLPDTTKQNLKKAEKKEEIQKDQIPAVQALRKKYQEQRLAKQNPTNVTKLAQKVKGKNMMRTRSSTVKEEPTSPKKQAVLKKSKTASSGLRSGLQRSAKPAAKKLTAKPLKKILRAGLRSGGGTSAKDMEKSADAKTVGTVKKTDPMRKPKPETVELKSKPSKTGFKKPSEGLSDFSSDDNEPLLAVKKPKFVPKKGVKKSIAEVKQEKMISTRTRSQIGEMESPSQTSIRPTRKTKEAAAVYMEMITKKLVSPDKSGDDDLSSVDSFPELPNAKRSEQRETEIKAKALARKVTSNQKTRCVEEKERETRRTLFKKTEQSKKSDVKSTKDDIQKKAVAVKKDVSVEKKQEEKPASTKKVQKSKEETTKTKPSIKEDVLKTKPVAKEILTDTNESSSTSSRPSTRSRSQEEQVVSKEAKAKTLAGKKVVKKSKLLIQNRIKTRNIAVKVMRITRQTEETVGKQNESPEEITQPTGRQQVISKKGPEESQTKKVVDKGPKDGKKPVDKSAKSGKPKVDLAKTDEKDAKAVKSEEAADAKKSNKKEIKDKPTVTKLGKSFVRLEKKIPEVETKKPEAVISSKRPTRKCSAVDKIWIDIDGFTSDEDDFVDDKVMTAIKSAATRKSEAESTSDKEGNKSSSRSKTKTDVSEKSEKNSSSIGESSKDNTKKSGQIDAKVSQSDSKKVGNQLTTFRSTKNDEGKALSPAVEETTPKHAVVALKPVAPKISNSEPLVPAKNEKTTAETRPDVKEAKVVVEKSNEVMGKLKVCDNSSKDVNSGDVQPTKNVNVTTEKASASLLVPSVPLSSIAVAATQEIQVKQMNLSSANALGSLAKPKEANSESTSVFGIQPSEYMHSILPSIAKLVDCRIRIPELKRTCKEVDSAVDKDILNVAKDINASLEKSRTPGGLLQALTRDILEKDKEAEKKINVPKTEIKYVNSVEDIKMKGSNFVAGCKNDSPKRNNVNKKIIADTKDMIEAVKAAGSGKVTISFPVPECKPCAPLSNVKKEVKIVDGIKVDQLVPKPSAETKLEKLREVKTEKECETQVKVMATKAELHRGAESIKHVARKTSETTSKPDILKDPEKSIEGPSKSKKQPARKKKETTPLRNLRERRSLNFPSDLFEASPMRRTRPVRQCSTGEKLWIESDSESTFYESSEDEEDIMEQIRCSENKLLSEKAAKSFPKDNIKTSTPKEKAKESPKQTKPKAEEPKKLGKQTESKKKDDSSDDSYFSESDEEPLQKKSDAMAQDKLKEEQAAKSIQLLSEMKLRNVQLHSQGVGSNSLLPGTKTMLKESSTKYYESCNNQDMNASRSLEFFSKVVENSTSSTPLKLDNTMQMLKKDEKADDSSVRQTYPGQTPTSHVPVLVSPVQYVCSYPARNEPINTHGLDLLSEVAPFTLGRDVTSIDKIHLSTERIEKWLKESLGVDPKKGFPYEESEFKGKGEVVEKKDSSTEFSFEQTQSFVKTSSSQQTPPEVERSQQRSFIIEIPEQKDVKKTPVKIDTKQDKSEAVPKKIVTSVQDLLKLQKERKGSPKSFLENTPHPKNCKCNSCVVKKGWFKNKVVPVSEDSQKSRDDVFEAPDKPFDQLSKAFTKVSDEGSKASASVAPLLRSPPQGSTATASKSGDKKPIFQQRKLSFLERMKERERKEAAASKPSPNAFSPNNESSVYAFEPEPEQPPLMSTPFRSRTRDSRTSSTTTSKSEEDILKICEDEVLPTSSSGTQVDKKLQDAKSLSKSSLSASIAVQVNLDTEATSPVEAAQELPDGKSMEISTQTEVPEDDADSHMFYIPLKQSANVGTSASNQQMIQGVALKVGTDGPMGPNQRLIMKAKLVTKPPETPDTNAVVMPQPKRIFDQSQKSNPPVGTVQPTTRKPPEPSPKTSDAATQPQPVAKTGAALRSETSAAAELASQTSVDSGVGSSVSSETTKDSKLSPSAKSVASKASSSKGDILEDNSPGSSTSSKSKRSSKAKQDVIPSSSTSTPPGAAQLVEAPIFHPTEKEFQDPLEFFERIRPAAEQFGICRIVPPSNFKPDCKVMDDMRFTAYNQYVSRMLQRWGPNVKEMMAIKKYLATQSISLKQPPWIGGIEVDLPRLYQSVQNCGGLMKVMEKKKWQQVADMMRIPKAAQDRVTKLDDIYCKYLLPYDTLSHDERQKLFEEVEKDWQEKQNAPPNTEGGEDSEEEETYIDECEECIVKGRNVALNQFYRIARNTMSMWFKSPEPSAEEVETEFWRHVSERNHHVCVHSGSIDSSGWGYGFPVAKNNAFSRHSWNLKVLTNNNSSVLRSLGPVMGVTVPTLHVGMVFTAFCWYRDPHGLPWIEYLHTGAPKIWYGISDDNSPAFREALNKLLPRHIKHKPIWLPSETAMVPPSLLVEHGVSLCHTVQQPGQFIVVFPRAFISSICTGYLVSESVYFTQSNWLATAEQVFKDIRDSCEPTMFSLEKLLFNIATDTRSSVEVLKQILPMVSQVRQNEIDSRKTLFDLGLKTSERLPLPESGGKKRKGRWAPDDEGDYECEICRANLFVSLVTNSHEEGVYCLPHAIELLSQKLHHLKYCKLMYGYTQEEINELIEKLEQRIESKTQKKLQNKSCSSK